MTGQGPNRIGLSEFNNGPKEDKVIYEGKFEAGKLDGMWMIGEVVGEFEMEMLC